jgi:uncharacterized membrane protein YdbT with pleckstrin-like domain
MSNQESIKEAPIVIRKSIVLFILRIMLLELIFELIYLTWRTLTHFMPLPVETVLTLNAISIIVFIVLVTIIQNIFLIYIALIWVNDYYEIRQREIAHISGIFSKTEKAYPFHDIQSITVHQSFLGRIFNYGSIHLYIPILGHDLNFTEVPSPAKIVEKIKSANPKIEGRYILKR